MKRLAQRVYQKNFSEITFQQKNTKIGKIDLSEKPVYLGGTGSTPKYFSIPVILGLTAYGQVLIMPTKFGDNRLADSRDLGWGYPIKK